MSGVRTGLDVAVGWLRTGDRPAAHRLAADLLHEGRLGLVCNPSAVTSDLRAAPDALRAAGANVVALFGPEHGVRGDLPDGEPVPHGRDERTGLPVWSLYTHAYEPTAEMLAGLDALVFDLQDIGARFYTYAGTLSHVMRGAAAAGIPVIVLDRPNPLGGLALEGPILEPEHASLVGRHPIPIRHGATLGELGRLWARFGAGEEPYVVPCAGWKRDMLWRHTGLAWVPPSPAMPAPETALVYPGICLLEGTNVSEGRGTANPFQWFGAPWAQAEELADRLNAEELPGCRFRPIRFRPTASKHHGEVCEGCQLHVTDPAAFLPVAAGVAVLSVFRTVYDTFAWRETAATYAVDRLAGSTRLRTAIDAGLSWPELAAEWLEGLDAHRRLLLDVALYS